MHMVTICHPTVFRQCLQQVLEQNNSTAARPTQDSSTICSGVTCIYGLLLIAAVATSFLTHLCRLLHRSPCLLLLPPLPCVRPSKVLLPVVRLEPPPPRLSAVRRRLCRRIGVPWAGLVGDLEHVRAVVQQRSQAPRPLQATDYSRRLEQTVLQVAQHGH